MELHAPSSSPFRQTQSLQYPVFSSSPGSRRSVSTPSIPSPFDSIALFPTQKDPSRKGRETRCSSERNQRSSPQENNLEDPGHPRAFDHKVIKTIRRLSFGEILPIQRKAVLPPGSSREFPCPDSAIRRSIDTHPNLPRRREPQQQRRVPSLPDDGVGKQTGASRTPRRVGCHPRGGAGNTNRGVRHSRRGRPSGCNGHGIGRSRGDG